MEKHIVKIISVDEVTHDVKRFRVEKPDGYSFTPGQATDVAINKKDYEDQNRPFTFTSLNDWDFLEFTIKIYKERGGVTNMLGNLVPGDEIIIHDVWGAINYKGSGIFIAAGAGVTPFIAILRDLKKKNQVSENKVFFSNKTAKDIILKDEFLDILGENFINTLTREKNLKFLNKKIDKEFLKENVSDFNKNFYVCGPDKFVQDINKNLEELGAEPDSLIFEK